MKSKQENSSKSVQFRSLSVLIAVACIDMLGFAMIFPLLPFYALEMNISPQFIGVIIASFSVAQLLAAPLWGRVSDRYGRRPAVADRPDRFDDLLRRLRVCEFILAAASVPGLSRAPEGDTTGVLHAYVADTIPAEDRARSLGWLSAATSAGTMIGPVIGSTAAYWGQAAPGLGRRESMCGQYRLRLGLARGVLDGRRRQPQSQKEASLALRLDNRASPGPDRFAPGVDLCDRDAGVFIVYLGYRLVPGFRIRRERAKHRVRFSVYRVPVCRDAVPPAGPGSSPDSVRRGRCDWVRSH